jgi:hypothetical protein
LLGRNNNFILRANGEGSMALGEKEKVRNPRPEELQENFQNFEIFAEIKTKEKKQG